MTSSISFLKSVNIIGNIYEGEDNKNIENENISAIEVIDDLLIIGADEGRTIKVLKYDIKVRICTAYYSGRSSVCKPWWARRPRSHTD